MLSGICESLPLGETPQQLLRGESVLVYSAGLAKRPHRRQRAFRGVIFSSILKSIVYRHLSQVTLNRPLAGEVRQ